MFWYASRSPGCLPSEIGWSLEFGWRQCRYRPDENTGIFMNSPCCIVVLAEVQLAGMVGSCTGSSAASSAESPGGVQCLYLIAEEGKEGCDLIWAGWCFKVRTGQDVALLQCYQCYWWELQDGFSVQFCVVILTTHQGEENGSAQMHQNSKEVHVCRLEQSWHYLTGFGRQVKPA